MRSVDTHGKIPEYARFLSIFSFIFGLFFEKDTKKDFLYSISAQFTLILTKIQQISSKRNMKTAILLLRVLYKSSLKIIKSLKFQKTVHSIDLFIYSTFEDDRTLLEKITKIYKPKTELLKTRSN